MIGDLAFRTRILLFEATPQPSEEDSTDLAASGAIPDEKVRQWGSGAIEGQDQLTPWLTSQLLLTGRV